jgi:catechol 2,3-dioxygenase-like lactoylglutathione lyase family enzyme
LTTSSDDTLPALVCHSLRVDDLARSLAFYTDVLGMREEAPALQPADDRRRRCRYAGPGRADAALELVAEPVLHHEPRDTGAVDGYWKIGITVPDVDAACAHLRAAGIEVEDPAQFEDIAYLSHLRDPDGYAIELLQKPVALRASAVATGAGPFAEATLAHVTLRVRDPEQSLAFYRGELGMHLLSRQQIRRYEFTLYFLTFGDEAAPHAYAEPARHREWLWGRGYTVLELQHHYADGAEAVGADPASGYLGITVRLPGDAAALAGRKDAFTLHDPDGYPVHVVANA